MSASAEILEELMEAAHLLAESFNSPSIALVRTLGQLWEKAGRAVHFPWSSTPDLHILRGDTVAAFHRSVLLCIVFCKLNINKYRTALAWRPHYFVASCQARPYSNLQQCFILFVSYSTANLYLLRYLLVWQHLLMLRIPATLASSEHYIGNSQVLRTETLFW